MFVDTTTFLPMAPEGMHAVIRRRRVSHREEATMDHQRERHVAHRWGGLAAPPRRFSAASMEAATSTTAQR